MYTFHFAGEVGLQEPLLNAKSQPEGKPHKRPASVEGGTMHAGDRDNCRQAKRHDPGQVKSRHNSTPQLETQFSERQPPRVSPFEREPASRDDQSPA